MIAVVFAFIQVNYERLSDGQDDGQIVAFSPNVYLAVAGYDGVSGHGLFDAPSLPG
jgi:hypothetical protein